MSAEDRIELLAVPVWVKPSSEGSIIVRRLIFPLAVLLFSRSLEADEIGAAGSAALRKALDRNRLIPEIAGTEAILVTLVGDEFPVQWPPNPAGCDLLVMAREQHPAELGPTEGAWQLQDPQDDQRTVASVLIADLATAMQAGTWAPETPLLIIFGNEDGNGNGDGDGDRNEATEAAVGVHATPSLS